VQQKEDHTTGLAGYTVKESHRRIEREGPGERDPWLPRTMQAVPHKHAMPKDLGETNLVVFGLVLAPGQQLLGGTVLLEACRLCIFPVSKKRERRRLGVGTKGDMKAERKPQRYSSFIKSLLVGSLVLTSGHNYGMSTLA
jgi:hypothetical protein